MSKLIEKKYGFLRYRQGDNSERFATLATPEFQPALSLDRSQDWHGYFSQSPKEYSQWLDKSIAEEAEFALMDLIKLSQTQKVIADVYIPLEMLTRIADKQQVVLLFAPEEMTRKHYFDRADKDEVYRFIMSFPDGKDLFNNVIEALNYNNAEKREAYINSGFHYIERSWDDTIEGMLSMIEHYFGL